MLAREGKVILPRPRPDDEGEDEAMDLDNAPSPVASGSKDGQAGAGKEEEDDRSPPVLGDVDEETLRRIRRGPLWERVKFRVLSRDVNDVEAEGGEEKEVWLNRVSLQISETDPLDSIHPAVVEGVKVEEDGEAAEAVEGGSDAKGKGKAVEMEGEDEEETASSKKVVGGFEGHGLLAEEVGLGKTLEVLSLILLRAYSFDSPNLHSLSPLPLADQDPKRRKLPSFFNAITDSEVQPSGITLIVAPTAIVGQWQSEIERLTPKLKVLRYEVRSSPLSPSVLLIVCCC
jgi:hypothetical protein